MKKIFIIICMCFAFAKANATFMQNYKQHTVEQGETIYTLTQKYKVTSEQLLELNPDLKAGLKYGQVLLIPAQNTVLTQRKIEKYKKHRVRRKETLYSLSKKYNITELDIKEANKQLYSNPLRKGDKIQIPIFKEVILSVQDLEPKKPVLDPTNLPDGKYLVKSSEGMYGIATKHHIKTKDLIKLNPDVKELRPGMILNVPKGVIIDVDPILIPSDTVSENEQLLMMEYTIPKKMGMYSLKKLSGINEDSLLSLNPHLKDGLKEGMKVTIPNPDYGKEVVMKSNLITTARLIDSLRNFKRQRIAVMLPISIHKTDGNANRDLLKSDRTMRIALDFYSGVKIAVDSANALGIPVDYDVFDTQKNLQTTKDILNGTDFADYNAVLGPLGSENVVETAKEIKRIGVPVISPLTNTKVELYRNLFQARPSGEVLKQQFKDFIVEYSKGKHVIIVTDNNNPKLRNEFTSILPNANVLVPDIEKNYIFSVNYIEKLQEDVENVVILAVDDDGFVTNAITNYSAKAGSHKITMFGLDNFEELDLPNSKLAQLNFVYPSMYKESQEDNLFVKKYYSTYSTTPNSYAVRGFDVTLDLILRQASSLDLYESVMRNGRTVMTENKFNYSKKSSSGYYNDAMYILQYQEDLSIKELDINNIVNKE
ncbi:LysM peptidoglycan-binding domain-containing protein [uncultured Nonlabens sp.]|uniref:LysM peptidoglycan-binding domain-containing protein n=1 Tax=uncultured Nonlabens sp. TaxID=859306 RepID=UPI002618B0DC|nr:LysM peptidoglycan-binding domain-containing protein [uncultured Nonlabens sp.]